MGLLDDENRTSVFKKTDVPKGKLFALVGIIVIVLLVYFFSKQLVAYVESGTYQVKQSWIDGKVYAKMTPGWWVKLGSIQPWPVAETFFFTRGKDAKADTPDDNSILVQFNEGSDCNISGTCRVSSPKSESSAIALTVNYGYKNWEDLREKLIRPQMRLALLIAANQMSARESYSERRTDFISMVSDQVLNGMYAYTEEEREIEDPGTGKKTRKLIKVIKKDTEGKALRLGNPFAEVGVTISNLDIKGFLYSDKVQDQIIKQQQAYMDIQTAVANAQKAQQDEITAAAQGKANVATAKYSEETEKVKAVVKAQKEKEVAELGAKRDKEVAETAAQRDLQVAMLNAKAAEQRKQAAILEAEGSSRATKMKMEADNYRAMEIQATIDIQRAWADAYAKKPVPVIFNGRSGDTSGTDPSGQNVSSVQSMVDLILLNTLQSNPSLMKTKPQWGATETQPRPPSAAPAPAPAATGQKK